MPLGRPTDDSHGPRRCRRILSIMGIARIPEGRSPTAIDAGRLAHSTARNQQFLNYECRDVPLR